MLKYNKKSDRGDDVLTAVYKLESAESYRVWDFVNYEDPKYDLTILFDLFDTYWNGPLQDIWAHFPLHVQSRDETKHLPYPNLQLFLPDLLVMDQVAKSKLENILSSYGEFLPIYSNERELFLFHLLNRLPALDVDQSEVQYLPGSNRIGNIRKYAFRKEVIDDQWIFDADQDSRAQIFVTDRFIELIEEYQLEGLDYILFWQGS